MKTTNRKEYRTLHGLCALVITAGILSACSEEMEKNLTGEPMLEITVSDETQDTATRMAYNGLKTTFEEGDAIGVYAVNGNAAVYSNVKYTLTDGKWVPTVKCPYGRQYTYYAYYPYMDYPATPSFSATGDEDSKFAAIISGWTVTSDQGTLEKFKANDLMMATGTYVSGRSVHFTMKHKMALAVLDSYVATFSYDTDPDIRYDVAMTFGGMIPYFDGTGYYLFMQPEMLTAIGGQQLKADKGCYITSSGAVQTEDYTMMFSTDGGNTFTATPPSWLKGVVETKAPDGETVNFMVSVSDEKTTDIVKGTATVQGSPVYVSEALRSAPTVNNRDLSMYNNDGTERESRTTANCYLIHNPGTYKIPLVYGNAIKNGMENSQAYQSEVMGDNIMQSLVRHDDQPITAPWIKDNGINVDGAELLWQDVKGLITEVGIEGDYLTFTVSEENITAGNAIIAAKTGDTTVWSWHIWATEETLDNTASITYTFNTSKWSTYTLRGHMAKCYIGQNPSYPHGNITKTTYSGASCTIRLCFANGTTISFNVNAPDYIEETHNITLRHCAPYYQWGRKDPMIPSDGENQRHDTWDINGKKRNSNPVKDGTGSTIGAGIMHPEVVYYKDGKPFVDMKDNLWSINLNTPVNLSAQYMNDQFRGKTVYDPCPPDYRVPACMVLYALNKQSDVTASSDENYSRWWAYGGESLHLYLLDYTMGEGSIVVGNNRETRLWSASNNYYFSFSKRATYESTLIKYYSTTYTSPGHCILPCREL